MPQRRRLAHLLSGLRSAAAAEAGGRVSSWPLADPVVYAEQLPGEDQPGISPAEAAFFRENGFVVKRRLFSRESLAPGREVFWENVPRCIVKDDPSTWVDPARHDEWAKNTSPAESVKGRKGLQFGGTQLKVHGAGLQQWMLDMIPRQPQMLATVEALIGGPVQPPLQNRGLYTVFPASPDGPAPSLGPHLDGHQWQLGSITLLEDCPPHTGGTTIWPVRIPSSSSPPVHANAVTCL